MQGSLSFFAVFYCPDKGFKLFQIHFVFLYKLGNKAGIAVVVVLGHHVGNGVAAILPLADFAMGTLSRKPFSSRNLTSVPTVL